MNDTLIKIIIADDHQMIRETWKLLLQQHERFDIIGECSSGAEAIVAAQELNPDIILMDINMAPVNGFEATRKIGRLAPNVRIIGVSIHNQAGYARNMLQLGARGYVTKNSPREEMIEAILEVHNGGSYICSEIRDKMIKKPDEEL